jgi:MFS transporter, DHA1 family, multidrug resistance protein
MTSPVRTRPVASRRAAAPLGAAVLATVVLVSAIAPLATDMYVPAFPAVGSDLGASAAQVQLALSTFFVGMALGQLVVGPLLGAVILQLPHWRVSFWAVAALGAAMIVAVAVGVRELLPADRRHSGGLAGLARSAGQVLSRPRFVAYLIIMSFSMGVTFAYVATSAFILQTMNGLSPILYSLDFAANAVGLAAATLLAARLAGRVPTRVVIGAGLLATGAAGVLLLAGSLWFGTPLPLVMAGFFLLMTAQGLVGANAGALASAEVPQHPGTGSAALGFLQWCMAGVIAPIAGLGGDRTATPMAIIIVVLAAASLVSLLVLARPGRR